MRPHELARYVIFSQKVHNAAMAKKRGTFIVIDGIGGCGKSTAVKMLGTRMGKGIVLTHEPGGTPFAEKIRRTLLRGAGPADNPLADFFLFWAARAEHVRDRILPALRAGETVISDRFDSSTYAFQLAGEKHPEFEKLFWETRKAALKDAEPDMYIILDVTVAEAASRRKKRGKVIDRFDEREAAFQNRIRSGFKRFAKTMGRRAHVIDASGTPEETEQELLKILRRHGMSLVQ